ncbi:DNA repair protein RadA [Thomasclavelia cocleata]|uniref:DNA repair protein RadA n=1 Tax=Thomasclavelia cocleata TaxID=69824 RepID=UPI00256EDB2D|nr:DNA repair protein RadA [Thomasclavelia cocleata]
MAKKDTIFVCNNCGAEFPKWQGKCTNCGSWSSLVEEKITTSALTGKPSKKVISSNEPKLLKDVEVISNHRINTGLNELNRVLGGGLVSDSAVLIGGDPGIGKSTLLLQICNHLSKEGVVLYISGEESSSQIKMRADRIGIDLSCAYVLAENDLDVITTKVNSLKPNIIILDSIQTVFSPEITSAAGSVSQVREATTILTRIAKQNNAAIFIIGHVTKEGTIAGPRVLEHLVDTVLYFEGDRYDSYRILRAVKNRFGSTNEIGIFEMKDKGFEEVKNPSGLFLNREGEETGCCVACILEGTRPMLIEIQALVSDSSFGNPRRMATGIDYNRMIMLTAVLEKKCGMIFANQDMYMNVIGGLKIIEPSADLSIICAICSSFKDKKIDNNIIIIGEVSLTGEVRGISNIDKRINEAEKLGFKKAIIPFSNFKSLKKYDTIDIIPVKTVSDALKEIFE